MSAIGLLVGQDITIGGTEYVLVTKRWYEDASQVMRNGPCPFCNSDSEPIFRKGDEYSTAQYGCRDCNRWWNRP